jgi:Zn-dependent protease with chaperone function
MIALGAVVVFASFATITSAATWLVALWPVREAESPRLRATHVFWRAVLPMAIGGAATVMLVGPAFFVFEPLDTGERPGFILLAIGAVGVWQALRVTWRTGRIIFVTRRVTQRWATTSSPVVGEPWTVPTSVIDTGVPIVAAAGVLRPRVFVDKSVLRTCDVRELAVVAAHEAAHIRRHDNLRKFLIAVCAGGSSQVARAWRIDAERAADDAAADTLEKSVDLAGALVKIAGRASAPTFETLAVSGVVDNFEARVRRLLAANRLVSISAERPSANHSSVLAITTLIVVVSGLTLVPIHELIELLVNRLP